MLEYKVVDGARSMSMGRKTRRKECVFADMKKLDLHGEDAQDCAARRIRIIGKRLTRA